MSVSPAEKPLRVLLYTDADVFAGTERHMLDLARGLRDAGVSVSVACPSPAALEERAASEGLPTQAIPKQGLIDWNAVGILTRLLRDGEVEIVHAHNGRTALAAALATRRAGRGKCLMTQHFLEPNHTTQRGPKAAVSGLAHHWVTAQMSGILAISQAVKVALLARHEAPENKITVIPNGISTPDPKLMGERAAVRAALGVPQNAPLVVCAARLEAEKDISSLIQAMTEVRAALPDVHCLVAGTGTQQGALQEQIDRLGLAQTVTLLGFRPDALALIAAADLFVLPSLAEPFGLALLEAMALGRPVIATCAGGPLEIVEEGKTGLLVPPSSPEKLAAATVRLLSEPGEARKMGAAGLARFQEQFTAARMAQATLAVYRQAAA